MISLLWFDSKNCTIASPWRFESASPRPARSGNSSRPTSTARPSSRRSSSRCRCTRTELKEVRKKEEEWKLELEHFQRQKGMVTNEREFTAVISEIDYATKALEEAAARRQ